MAKRERDEMDAYILDQTRIIPSGDWESAPEVAKWLEVSGDLDDFIYYGEEPRHSEKYNRNIAITRGAVA